MFICSAFIVGGECGDFFHILTVLTRTVSCIVCIVCMKFVLDDPLALPWYDTLLQLCYWRWCWYDSFAMPREASSGFNVMTHRWFKLVTACLFHFHLALAAKVINTVLCLSSSVTLSIPVSPIWSNVTQPNLNGHMFKLCPVGFHMACRQACAWLDWSSAYVMDKNANEALGANRQYAAQAIVWAVLSAYRCSLGALYHICTLLLGWVLNLLIPVLFC